MSRIRLTRVASITSELDRIAGELETSIPEAALALDQISDILEGRTAAISDFFKNPITFLKSLKVQKDFSPIVKDIFPENEIKEAMIHYSIDSANEFSKWVITAIYKMAVKKQQVEKELNALFEKTKNEMYTMLSHDPKFNKIEDRKLKMAAVTFANGVKNLVLISLAPLKRLKPDQILTKEDVLNWVKSTNDEMKTQGALLIPKLDEELKKIDGGLQNVFESPALSKQAGSEFIHVYKDGENQIAVTFNVQKNSPLEVKLTDPSKAVTEPSALKSKFPGKKIFHYSGLINGLEVPVFVVTSASTKPYTNNSMVSLSSPEILSSGTSKMIQKKLEPQAPIVSRK